MKILMFNKGIKTVRVFLSDLELSHRSADMEYELLGICDES